MKASLKSCGYLSREVTPLRRYGFKVGSGLKNGALLDAAEKTGFDLFITADQELTYQQNLTRRTIALVVLSTNNWSFIKAHIAGIMAAVSAATPGSYAEVEIPLA